jgi:deazaflavin-dependent oxidoreductase (nitroreductase family)
MIKTFPVPGTALADILGEESKRRAFHANTRFINRYVVFAYRIGLLPLLGAGGSMMLIGTVGRKTGKLRYFPVSYIDLGGEKLLISGWGEDSNWYKNIVASPENVNLQVGFQRIRVKPVFVEAAEKKLGIIRRIIEEKPGDAKRIFGWDPQTDRMQDADFSAILEKALFVRFLPMG